jgi:heparosan-N-sulfate-glucuronate 5-epimerase
MIASRFYHTLHVAQLRVMYRLTGESIFQDFAEKWATYLQGPLNRNAALGLKVVFKLLYY